MKLTDEAVSIVVSNYGQGIIMIDDFSQLNEKYVEGLCRVPQEPGGTIGGVSNTGVVFLAMAEENLQGMICYIKNFKRIGSTCMHFDVELTNVRAMCHHQEMEEDHKYPEVVPTFEPKEWTKTLETVEE